MNETIFRVVAALVFFVGLGISIYFRRKADKDTGETIPRNVDGAVMMYIIRVGGLALWLSPLVYLINPEWMSWSKFGLLDWMRWSGVLISTACTILIYWLFKSIGKGISPTSATRTEHSLVTSGPYRYVRHPLYTISTTFFISFGMIADNWFIIILGVLSFVAMAIRTPKEEANLIAKFGDEYKEYMKKTGRFLPRSTR